MTMRGQPKRTPLKRPELPLIDDYRIRLNVNVKDAENHIIERRIRVLVAPKPGWVPEWFWRRMVGWVLDVSNTRSGL